MAASLFKKFRHSRRAAVAVALALMTVPLLISASAAVDFSRIASARALLQASVDASAEASVGAWQMSQSSTNANTVGIAAYNATGAQLNNFVTPSSFTLSLDCTGTTGATGQATNQCGTPGAAYTQGTLAGCPTQTVAGTTSANYEYCASVTASVTLKNSLFAYLIPPETLTATSIASAQFPNSTYTPPGTNPNFGSAFDYSGMYATAVPPNANGSGYNYNTLAPPNSNCSHITGPLQYVPEQSASNGVTNCNYVYLGDSKGEAGSGSITLAQGQPVAFTFVNYTGATTSYGSQNAYSDLDVTVNGTTTNYPNGYTVPAVTCSRNQRNCTASPATVLYGSCPQTNLYGSIAQGGGTPTSDSLNEFYSGYEEIGYPPSHNANHVLTEFTPTYSANNFTVGGTTYSVKADQCPQSASPTTQAAGNNADNRINQDTSITAYATYYPDVTYDDVTSAIYPPQISACSPVGNAPDLNYSTATPNASTSNLWWGWANSNYGNCTLKNLWKGTSTSDSASRASTFPASNNNCALIIQPLGTQVPTNGASPASLLLPDFYRLIEAQDGTILALDPVYDGKTFYDPVAQINFTSPNSAGYTPSSTSATIIGSTGLLGGGLYVGDEAVTEQPAKNTAGSYDHNPPADTSGHCYNPQDAIQDNGYIVDGYDVLGYTSSGAAVDPVANPQLGAVVCNPTAPASYALYWNDLGGVQGDDVGYWNAIVLFTCPSEPTTSGGGASTISG